MADDSKATSFMGKLWATIFGAVIAPILVALGVKVIPDMLATKPTSTTQAPTTNQTPEATPTTKHKPGPPPALTTRRRPLHTGPSGSSPPSNDEINFITSKLGDLCYSYSAPEKKPLVKNEMVDPALFKYVAMPASIAVTAAPPCGLLTKKEYENYELSVEFRWDKASPGREGKGPAAAILLHAVGPDGAFDKSTPECVAVLLTEGKLGAIQLRGAPNKIKCIAKMKELPDKRREYIGGEMFGLPLASGEPAGWDGILYPLATPEGNPVKPGDWHKILVNCDGDTLRVSVNNKLVNEIKGLNVKKGRVGFAAQHAAFTLGKAELLLVRN